MVATLPIWAQPTSTAVRLANLEQDMRLLQQTVGQLRLEVEAMGRENEQLRATVDRQLARNRGEFITLQTLNQRLAAFTKDVEASLSANQKETIEQVAEQIDSLAQQTQKALEALARSNAAAPQLAAESPSFNDDFPKSGVSYTVKSGDSLGKIAREQRSNIEWIRNANRIAGDLIYPGQQLFIPQKD